MKNIRTTVATVLFALGISAAHAADITLGMVVGTTGPFAGGEAPLVNGAKMAVDEINKGGGINGDMIQLIIEDTGSEQTGAINAYNRILGQSPVAIMNTTVSGFVLSQIGTISDEGIPTFTGGASPQLSPAKTGTEALMRIRTSDVAVAAAAAVFALDELKSERLAVVRVNDEYGNGWLRVIEETVKARDKELVVVESYETADRDVTPQLLKVREAKADVLIFVGNPPNYAGALQQLQQLGIKAKVIVSNSGVLPSTMKLYQPGAADGIYGTVDSVPAIDAQHAEWAARYREAFGVDADYSAAEYYDGVMMVANAIKAVGTDREALLKQLRSIKDYVGVGNSYTYADMGDGGTAVAIVQIENGALRLVTTIK